MTRFSGTPLDYFFVLFSFQQTLVRNVSKLRCCGARRGFFNAIKRRRAAVADDDSSGRWTAPPRRYEPAC